MKSMNLLSIKLILVAIACFFSLSTALAQDLELTIIGNYESVPDELKDNILRSVFLGEKQQWDDGVGVKIALMKTTTPIGEATCRKVYKMTSNELNKYFLALVFQGKVKAPTFFGSVSELKSYVAETPGAIGVIQGPIDGQIKIITVDGKKQLK
jgi:hypothetical protein